MTGLNSQRFMRALGIGVTAVRPSRRKVMRSIFMIFPVVFAIGCISTLCRPEDSTASHKAENIGVTKVGFSVIYKDGWSAHTDFTEDLNVQGAHISGGDHPFVHMVDDTASRRMWMRLVVLSLDASRLPSIDITPDPDKVYIIKISLSDGSHRYYETELETYFKQKELKSLADILHKNERIYISQKGNPWVLE